MSIQKKPEGYHTVTPYLTVKNADTLIDFLKKIFNANSVECVRDEQGKTMHAEVKIGDSVVMIGSKSDAQTSNAMLYVYVDDTDATYKRALAAGAKSLMEPSDKFYGDRNAGIEDMYGNQWWIATHVEDVSMAEMQKRAATTMKEQSKSSCCGHDHGHGHKH